MKANCTIYMNLLVTMVLFFTACSKNEDYNRKPAAYINFYNASEVLQQNDRQQTNNMVFINDSIANSSYSSKKFPMFGPTYAEVTTPRQYPFETTDVPTGSIVIQPTGYQYIYYMALAPSDYRFIYTGNNKAYWQESRLNLAQDSFTQMYLTEDTEHDRYRIVAVPDERNTTPGKVRLRFVHLSADTEPLEISRVLADGRTNAVNFQSSVPFGNATGYVALDTLGSSKQFKQIVLKLSPVSMPDQSLLTVSIPAEVGGSFTVLICGLKNETKRTAITSYDGSGQPIRTEFTVVPNLRTVLRRNY